MAASAATSDGEVPFIRWASQKSGYPENKAGRNAVTISSKALCVIYGLIGLVALIGTWGNNVDYLNLGFLGANLRFWEDTLANPASRSITVDIFFLGLAMFVWMVLEARRLRMRGVWLYLVFGMLIAVSFTFPLFLINRERVLATLDASAGGGSLGMADVAGLIAVGLALLAYSVVTLLQ